MWTAGHVVLKEHPMDLLPWLGLIRDVGLMLTALYLAWVFVQLTPRRKE